MIDREALAGAVRKLDSIQPAGNYGLVSRREVLRLIEQAAPDGLAEARLRMIDGIGTDLSRELAQGDPFEPFDRIYVLKRITAALDAARARTLAATPVPFADSDAEAEARFLQPINPDPITTSLRAEKKR